MEEIEVKFLDIDLPKLETQLTQLGVKKHFDRLYKRKVYDYPDLRLNQQGAWVRVRDEGEKVVMTFKQRLGYNRQGGNDTSTEEVEFRVDNFDTACLFLEKIGLKMKFYEENRRVRYTLKDITFDIDHWPLLQPYLEIEADSWEKIDEGIELLGLNPAEKKIYPTYEVYKLNGIDEHDYTELTFDRQVKKNG